MKTPIELQVLKQKLSLHHLETGQLLRDLRTRYHLTQKQVARHYGGRKHQTISRIENGLAPITPATIKAYHNAALFAGEVLLDK